MAVGSAWAVQKATFEAEDRVDREGLGRLRFLTFYGVDVYNTVGMGSHRNGEGRNGGCLPAAVPMRAQFRARPFYLQARSRDAPARRFLLLWLTALR